MSRRNRSKSASLGSMLLKEAKSLVKEFQYQVFGGRLKKKKTIVFYNGKPIFKIENGKRIYYRCR